MQVFHNYGVLTLLGASLLAPGIDFTAPTADVAVAITNNSTANIVVTVYDMNTNSHRPVLANQTIYGFSSVPVSLTADAAGKGHVLWTASSHAAETALCGHGNQSGLTQHDAVEIHVDSSCTET